jgi:hypothetical protein
MTSFFAAAIKRGDGLVELHGDTLREALGKQEGASLWQFVASLGRVHYTETCERQRSRHCTTWPVSFSS